ncbi:MAG: ketopantoate reductase family protein, partial [Rubrivivax sp.]
MSQRIVVFGAGAIGGVVAWRLARAGAHVSLVARGAALASIGARGLRVSVGDQDEGQERLRVPVIDLAAGLGSELPADLLLLAVKVQDLPGALAAAAPLIAPHTTVVPLVNGLPWWLFHGVHGAHGAYAGPIEAVDPGGQLWRSVPPQQVLGAVVHLGAEVVEPGWVRQAGDGRLTLGELDGSLSPRAQDLAALREAGGRPTR